MLQDVQKSAQNIHASIMGGPKDPHHATTSVAFTYFPILPNMESFACGGVVNIRTCALRVNLDCKDKDEERSVLQTHSPHHQASLSSSSF